MEKSIDEILRNLQSGDVQTRARAIRELGTITFDPVIKLRSVLENEYEDYRVRCAAVEGLLLTKDPRALELIINALNDRDFMVRKAAAWALGEMKDAKGAKPLIELLEKEDIEWVRQVAVESLEEIFAALQEKIQKLEKKVQELSQNK